MPESVGLEFELCHMPPRDVFVCCRTEREDAGFWEEIRVCRVRQPVRAPVSSALAHAPTRQRPAPRMSYLWRTLPLAQLTQTPPLEIPRGKTRRERPESLVSDMRQVVPHSVPSARSYAIAQWSEESPMSPVWASVCQTLHSALPPDILALCTGSISWKNVPLEHDPGNL